VGGVAKALAAGLNALGGEIHPRVARARRDQKARPSAEARSDFQDMAGGQEAPKPRVNRAEPLRLTAPPGGAPLLALAGPVVMAVPGRRVPFDVGHVLAGRLAAGSPRGNVRETPGELPAVQAERFAYGRRDRPSWAPCRRATGVVSTRRHASVSPEDPSAPTRVETTLASARNSLPTSWTAREWEPIAPSAAVSLKIGLRAVCAIGIRLR
jgi:hypothetical protein